MIDGKLETYDQIPSSFFFATPPSSIFFYERIVKSIRIRGFSSTTHTYGCVSKTQDRIRKRQGKSLHKTHPGLAFPYIQTKRLGPGRATRQRQDQRRAAEHALSASSQVITQRKRKPTFLASLVIRNENKRRPSRRKCRVSNKPIYSDGSKTTQRRAANG